jgi:hypothetical protein
MLPRSFALSRLDQSPGVVNGGLAELGTQNRLHLRIARVVPDLQLGEAMQVFGIAERIPALMNQTVRMIAFARQDPVHVPSRRMVRHARKEVVVFAVGETDPKRPGCFRR